MRKDVLYEVPCETSDRGKLIMKITGTGIGSVTVGIGIGSVTVG